MDVCYSDRVTRAAALVFNDWSSDEVIEQATVTDDTAAGAYEPGAFYKRELPPLLAVLAALTLPPALILVDAYVYLGADRRPGLGQRLHQALGGVTPIIGVAKNPYSGVEESTALRRGDSAKPLYVTAVGVDERWAQDRVREMHGPHRIPTLLKQVDRLSRGDD